MNLKDITLETKTVTVPFDGLDGFNITISAISRELSRKIRAESEITKLDPKHKITVQELDQELFVNKFAAAAIKGWTGLKYKYLQDLILVDLSKVDDLEDEVEFNLENAVELIKHSQIFDAWINEQVFGLHRFRG